MIVEGTLPSTEPAALALRMANHFGHKVPVETRDGIAHVQTAFGSFALEPQENQLDIRLVADTERRGDHQQHDGGHEQRAAERSSRRRCGRHLLVVGDDCEEGEKQHRLPIEDLARQQQDVDVHREQSTRHQRPGE